ncbi:SLBB domain-containing protein [Candidatus Neomarinimicrobiota bacterium]
MKKRVLPFVLLIVTSVNLFAQSIEDLQRLRQEYEQATQIIDLEQLPVKEIIESEKPALQTLPAKPPPKDSQQEYFGYAFFNDHERIDLWENLPLPADYRLGAGDEIIISIWGETQSRSEHTINRSGSIYIDKVGLVHLSGRTLGECKSYLRTQFERVYSTLRGPKSTTYIDVTIGNLKLINVTFVGEVTYPGIHAIHPFSTVTTGLIQAGGLEISGSLRKIQVLRAGKVEAVADMYSFLLKGKGTSDIQLRDQDIVIVPVRESTVTIQGQVHRPAIYEAVAGESAADLVAYSGFFKPRARTSLEIQHILPLANRQTDDDAIRIEYIPLPDLSHTIIQDGDKIVARDILPVKKEVYIYGRAKRPGKYPYQDPMRVLDLLELAGGIRDDSFWKSVYSERAELIRRDENGDYASSTFINLDKLREGDMTENLELQNLDQLVVRTNPFFDPPKNVKVHGEINIPGVYSIQKDNETLGDIFERAGGLTQLAFEEGIRMYREKSRVILSDYGIPVDGGDSIYVPIQPGVVRVRGEVYTPGLIHFQRGKSLKNYIESAGGYTLDAQKNKTSVTYANGNVKIKKTFASPKIEDGATITVHREVEKPPLNPTTLLTEIASITASLATIIFIISARPG